MGIGVDGVLGKRSSACMHIHIDACSTAVYEWVEQTNHIGAGFV